jgi:hypothetical protein
MKNLTVYEKLIEMYPEAKDTSIFPEKIEEACRSIPEAKKLAFAEFVFRTHRGKSLPNLPHLIKLVGVFHAGEHTRASDSGGNSSIADKERYHARWRSSFGGKRVFIHARQPEFKQWCLWMRERDMYQNIMNSIIRNLPQYVTYSDDEFAQVARTSTTTLLGWDFPAATPEAFQE